MQAQGILRASQSKALIVFGDVCDDNELDYKKFGRKVFNWMEQEADIRIRSQVTEPYVMRGSYHMLADQKLPRVH